MTLVLSVGDQLGEQTTHESCRIKQPVTMDLFEAKAQGYQLIEICVPAYFLGCPLC